MRFAWDGPSSRHRGVLHGGNQGYGSGVLGSAVCVHRVFVAQSPTFGMNTRTDLGIFILEAIQISTWSAVMSKEGGQSEAEKKQPAKGVKTEQSEGWNSWKEDNEILTVFTWGVCSFKVNGINICLSCWFFLCTSLFCANLLLWLEIPGQTCVFPRNFPQMDKHACVSQERPRWRGTPVFSKKDPDRLDKGVPIFFEKPKRHAWIYPFFLSMLTCTATLAAAVSTVTWQNPTKKSAIFVSWESDGNDAQFKYIYTHGLLLHIFVWSFQHCQLMPEAISSISDGADVN